MIINIYNYKIRNPYYRDNCFDAHLFRRLLCLYQCIFVNALQFNFLRVNITHHIKVRFSSSKKNMKNPSYYVSNPHSLFSFGEKRRSLTSQNVCFDWKQDNLFNVIHFLLENVIRCAQTPVDCLRASTLVTQW